MTFVEVKTFFEMSGKLLRAPKTNLKKKQTSRSQFPVLECRNELQHSDEKYRGHVLVKDETGCHQMKLGMIRRKTA